MSVKGRVAFAPPVPMVVPVATYIACRSRVPVAEPPLASGVSLPLTAGCGLLRFTTLPSETRAMPTPVAPPVTGSTPPASVPVGANWTVKVVALVVPSDALGSVPHLKLKLILGPDSGVPAEMRELTACRLTMSADVQVPRATLMVVGDVVEAVLAWPPSALAWDTAHALATMVPVKLMTCCWAEAPKGRARAETRAAAVKTVFMIQACAGVAQRAVEKVAVRLGVVGERIFAPQAFCQHRNSSKSCRYPVHAQMRPGHAGAAAPASAHLDALRLETLRHQ